MDNEHNKNTLLNYLDQPARFLFFTIDEFVALLLPILLGMGLGWAFTGCCISAVSFYLLRTLKKISGGGALRHLAYWYLPTSKKYMKIYIPSHIREWGP